MGVKRKKIEEEGQIRTRFAYKITKLADGSENFPLGISIFGKDSFCGYDVGVTDWPCICFFFHLSKLFITD